MKRKSRLCSSFSALLIPFASSLAAEELVEKKSDGDWIMLTGKVTDVRATNFDLDYGSGKIVVEIDGYNGEAKGNAFNVGQPVMVHGRVDKDNDGPQTVEALRVYTLDTQKTISANSDDEEGVIRAWRADKSTTTLTGTVAKIVGNRMEVNTNYQTFTIDVSLLPEEAFDSEGEVQIRVNDRVNVYGTFDDGFEKTSTLRAIQIRELKS